MKGKEKKLLEQFKRSIGTDIMWERFQSQMDLKILRILRIPST